MKKQIKVAFINYSLFAGGAERNIINLADYFNLHNVHTDILLFKDINEYEQEYRDSEHKLHIIPLLKTKRKISFYLLPFYAIILIYKLFLTVRRNKYDVLIGSEEYDPFYITIFFSKLFGIKNLLIVGNNIDFELRTKKNLAERFHRFMFNVSFQTADHIICVSKGLKENLINGFSINKNKITAIYNGVNGSTIKQKAIQSLSEKEKNYFQNHQVVITMGRLVYKKGLSHLIRAFALVNKIIPNTLLFIIGKGPLRKNLTTLIKKIGIDKAVILNGFEKENPYSLLKQGDLFVFSSLYEGFGNTIVEAMNCGLPVISTACPYGPREILGNNRWGILTPSISINDSLATQRYKEEILAKAIVRVLTNKKLLTKYKKACIIRAKSFPLDIMGEKYLKVINNVI